MSVSVKWRLVRTERGGGAWVVGQGTRDSLLLTGTQFLAIKTEGGRVNEI